LKIEIRFTDNTMEQCDIVKRFNNGDYVLDRKNRNRLELVTAYNDENLENSYNGRYIWINAYLKDRNGYEEVEVRRILT